MSTESTAVAGENNEQGTEAKSEFEAITSQEDFDKAIQARIARERSKFADYDEVKAKADKFTQIENENKTELQKKDDRIAELEAENGGLKATALRSSVAAAKGIPAELLTGSTREELEAAADALIKFRGEKADTKLVIPGEGKSPASGKGDGEVREFASQLFRTAD